MALSIQSPGVVFREVDNTFFPENIDSSIVGVVGLATKGPTNKPTLITQQRQLIETFGLPAESIPGQGLEGALEMLETTNELFFVRASNGSGIEASTVLKFGSCPAVQIAATSGFGITNSLYLNIIVSSATGLERSTSAAIVPSDVSGYGKTELALQAVLGNGTANDDDYGIAYFVDGEVTSIFLYGTHPGGHLAVSSYSNATLTTAISSLGVVSANGSLGTVNTSSASASGSLIDSTTAAGSFYYLVQALYEGTGYNQAVNLLTGETTGVGVETDAFGGPTVELTVNENGIQSENYVVSLLNDGTFIEDLIIPTANGTKSQLIKGSLKKANAEVSPTALDSFARPLSALDATLTGVVHTPFGATATSTGSPRFVKLVGAQNKGLIGGKDYFTENTTVYETIILGNQAAKTGIYALDDDTLNISIGIVPGVNNQRIQNALITLAETSQNFIAVISPPYGLANTQAAVDWMNGKSSTRTASINSSWATVVWPWVQTFNTFDGKDIWYDPAIYLVRQMTFTDAVAEPWFAPAGFRRGRLTKPTDVEFGLSQGDRDFLYKNNINPINNFIPEGITIFGQKTAQRIPSSLDRINVRRLMIYLRKLLLATGRPYIFEPNDAFTWEQITNTVESVLSDIQARRGIVNYQVLCDETVNTPVRVARKELWCKITLQPTEAAEYIVFEVNLTNQATSSGA